MTTPGKDVALDWFVRLQASPDDPVLRRQFQGWYDCDPGNAAAYDRIAAFWTSRAFDIATSQCMSADDIASPSRWSVRRYAAVAALLALAWFGFAEIELRVRADYRTAMGENREVVLADGSHAVLNSGSAIAVEMDAPPFRRVHVLRGEVFFTVSHDQSRPFIADGGGLQARVLGTGFSLRADSGHAAVMVRSGVVEVQGENGGPVHVAAGQAVALQGGSLAVLGDGAQAGLGWLDGVLVFHDQPLAAVLSELNRYYSGLIVLANPRLGQIRVSGNYRLDDPAAIAESLAKIVSAQTFHLAGAVIVLR